VVVVVVAAPMAPAGAALCIAPVAAAVAGAAPSRAAVRGAAA
jgi:hypothetical protein